jgi:hypothetical protein
MKKIVFLALLTLPLNSCTFNFWYKDLVTKGEKLESPKLQLLTIGMSKAEVISAIGQPDQMSSARKKGADFIETWEYIRVAAVPGPDQIAERYQVEFTNGKLSGYESSGDFKQQINLR